MRKKLLASILAVCMLFTMLPTAAFAADEDIAENAVLSDESAVVTTAPENEVPQGSGAETGTYVAKIGTVEYETLEAAVEAVKDGTPTEIKLLDNVTLTSGIVVDKKITLDLNGHTITTNAENYSNDYLVAVKRGGDLTIKDTVGGGAITTTSEKVYAGVKMTVKDDGETGDTATLTVNGGTIQGYYYGVVGNGARHGTDITINGGTITTANTEGDNTAIYHPQDGKLTVTGGTIIGNTGIEIRSGSLTVTGGIIKGGEGAPTSKGEASGTTTTNTGIAIAQHTTKKPIQVNITGGTISGGAAVYESNPQNNPAEETNKVSVEIRDVTLTGDVKAEGFGSVSLDNVTVSGNVTKGEDSTGSMGIVDSTITGNATGTDVTIVNSTVNGTLTNATPEGVVALVGGKTYTSLQEAITAATDGQTVKLLANSVNNTTVEIKDGRKLTLDMNGYNAGFTRQNHIRIYHGGLNIIGSGKLYEEDPWFAPVRIYGD